MNIISPRSGASFKLKKGSKLRVTDIKGEQVSDFFCVLENDHTEYLSSGRTLDYLSRLFIKEGDVLYSSKSRPLVKVVKDTVGCHDFLLTPCSCDTFRIIYGDKEPHHGCEGNIISALKEQGIEYPAIPITFNIFMNVPLEKDGSFTVKAPKSKAGDYIELEALEDIIVGLTACSALQSNNYAFKPIGYEVC
jgi:uncharacterized protein